MNSKIGVKLFEWQTFLFLESVEIPENRITNSQKSIGGESNSSLTTTTTTKRPIQQKSKKQKLKSEEKVDENKFLDTQSFHSALESHPQVLEHWNQV